MQPQPASKVGRQGVIRLRAAARECGVQVGLDEGGHPDLGEHIEVLDLCTPLLLLA